MLRACEQPVLRAPEDFVSGNLDREPWLQLIEIDRGTAELTRGGYVTLRGPASQARDVS